MALTGFGKAVRKARLDAEVNLSEMAEALQVSAALLSGMETGRKKVPVAWVEKIERFFAQRGVSISGLRALADVANKEVSLDGLSPSHQMMVAGFARGSWDAETLQKFGELLKAADGGKTQ